MLPSSVPGNGNGVLYCFIFSVVSALWTLNELKLTLRELKLYAFPKGSKEIHGVVSAFWQEENHIWKRINIITSRKDNIIATLVIDPIDFHENTVVEIYSTISYENLDTELQISMPIITFHSRDILSGTYDINLSQEPMYRVLALKSIFLESTIDLPFELNSDRTMSHLKLILSIVQGETSIPVTRLEEYRCVEAAEALIEELETYLGDLNFSRIQRARIKSDLLIP
ncbi:hypothetical protein M0802_016237 [Mischocyttarus mexicanus]|nr:hypothetical protein M0802_016237 [Mischocyttarus mexicanus]